MSKSKTYRFTPAMLENIKWLANEFDTTETKILEVLITYATGTHYSFINDGPSNIEFEKYMEMQINGLK